MIACNQTTGIEVDRIYLIRKQRQVLIEIKTLGQAFIFSKGAGFHFQRYI